MSKPSLIVVLLEDDRQKMLIYKYLIKCGFRRREIRIQLSPSGQGSAESWMRGKFVQETTEYRRRQARAQTALIVMIDADTHTVQDRLNQLDQALRDDRNQIVEQSEQIVRLIPKRNVETWILCLNQRTVDEVTDYKNTSDEWNDLITLGSEALYQWTRPQAAPPNHCVDSLRSGVGELKRLAF